MSMYHCEGFIKEVKITKERVAFILEPAAPYLFEKKEDGGKTKRLLLLVDDPQKPDSAKIMGNKEETWFSVPSEKCDLSAMLIAKANHMRVKVGLENVDPLPEVIALSIFTVV